MQKRELSSNRNIKMTDSNRCNKMCMAVKGPKLKTIISGETSYIETLLQIKLNIYKI